MSSPNDTPRYPSTVNDGFGITSAANTATDGTGTTIVVFTANASVQSRIDGGSIKCAGSTVATPGRFFENNGSSSSVATNNTYICEVQIPAFTASNTGVGPDLPIPPTLINRVVPKGYTILFALGTATGGGNIAVTINGADYT